MIFLSIAKTVSDIVDLAALIEMSLTTLMATASLLMPLWGFLELEVTLFGRQGDVSL